MQSKFTDESGLVVTNVCRMAKYLGEAGFYKTGEVAFPHKQSSVMKIDRESWEAPRS